MTALILDSLQRRMAAMHSLYYQAVSTMGPEHVNHFEREKVLPIAFSLFHYTNQEDANFMFITGQMPIWNDEWQSRLIIARPFPPQVASTYSARVAGPEGITVLDGFECWLYQHGLRHMGEIELARGLVGLGGMTS